MKFNEGYNNIKVSLIDWAGNDLARQVYTFGRLSHDFIDGLPEVYDEHNPECIKLIDKIIAGTTLPKYAMQGTRINFAIHDITRICLAQITRDPAFFASASTGVFPLSQEFNIPLSIYRNKKIMHKLEVAQQLLESAYIDACEAEIPSIEARYIGLHCQVISLTASFVPTDFVRACYSRTSSNFCDECNYVYRLMYAELKKAIAALTDKQSIKLWNWLLPESKCINDKLYTRERLFNSDFTYTNEAYMLKTKALNDWRNSGWKLELERMYEERPDLLTELEKETIDDWMRYEASHDDPLPTTYDNTQKDVLVNAIKETDYYKLHKKYSEQFNTEEA